MKTVLFLGAGPPPARGDPAREGARAPRRRDRRQPGRARACHDADIAEVVNFVDIPKAIEFAERIRPDGVLTITSDRAVVAVAAVAEALGLPGIGVDVAVGLTHKVEMRRRLERAGIPAAALRLRAARSRRRAPRRRTSASRS